MPPKWTNQTSPSRPIRFLSARHASLTSCFRDFFIVFRESLLALPAPHLRRTVRKHRRHRRLHYPLFVSAYTSRFGVDLMASTTRSSSPQDRVQSSQQPKSSSIHLSSARKTPPKSSLKTHSLSHDFFRPTMFLHFMYQHLCITTHRDRWRPVTHRADSTCRQIVQPCSFRPCFDRASDSRCRTVFGKPTATFSR